MDDQMYMHNTLFAIVPQSKQLLNVWHMNIKEQGAF